MENIFLSNKPYDLDRIFRVVATVVCLAVLVWILYLLRLVLLPFALALLLAYICNPIVNYTQYYVKNRVLAVAIVALAAILVLVGLVWALSPLIQSQAVQAGQALQNVVVDNNLPSTIASYIPEGILEAVRSYFSEGSLTDSLRQGDLLGSSYQLFKSALTPVSGLLSGIGSVVSAIGILLATALYLIFILIDFRSNTKDLSKLIPKEYRKSVTGFLHDFNHEMKAYFRGLLIVSLIGSALFATAFSIMQLPLGIVIGIVVGLLGMIPYMQLLGILPVSLLAVLHSAQTGSSVGVELLIVLAIFAGVQALQELVLMPKIVGDASGMKPMFVLLSLSIWGALLGLFGLIIAIPLSSLLLTLYRRFLRRQQQL